MKAAEVRAMFVDFFKEKKHEFVPSAPLIPQGDQTLLFVNAGMNQFKDIFLDLEAPKSPRVANYQKCLRVSGKHNDLEDVGYDTYHHTFFEMLGNWSFGDYYKKEAILWAWELFTDRLNLPKDKLYATVHHSDDEAMELWKELTDIDKDKVLKFGDKDNFWEMGETGPCGPCSEIHIDLGPEACDKGHVKGHECGVNGDCGRYIELWNLVFIQYNRDSKSDLSPLKSKHVDTGAGLERLVAVLQGKNSNYDTDLFQPIIKILEKKTGKQYSGQDAVAMRVISDHIRTLCFAISDGIIPSNEGRGYVIRRILRRAYRYGKNLGFNQPFLFELVDTVDEIMGDAFPELRDQKKHVIKMIKLEEERFAQTLDKGLELFEKVVSNLKDKTFPGNEAFVLYDTYGFPVDLTALLCRERDMELDMDEFNQEMEKQKEMARKAGKFKLDDTEIDWKIIADKEIKFVGYEHIESDVELLKYEIKDDQIKIVISPTPFYAESGGQVGDTGFIEGSHTKIEIFDVVKIGNDAVHLGKITGGFDEKDKLKAVVSKNRRTAIMKNHTATHLLHKALKMILGDHVKQAGSLVDDQRLRFDFNHFEKVTDKEIEQIEEIVNQEIQRCTSLLTGTHSMDEAMDMGATALFGEKYGDVVRVVKISDFSVELCGGTHVANTGEIGTFKVISESSVASGIRRIEALTGMNAFRMMARAYNTVDEISKRMNIETNEVGPKIAQMQKEMKKLKKNASKSGGNTAKKKLEPIETINGIKIFLDLIENVQNPNLLRQMNDDIKSREKDFITLLVGTGGAKNFYIAAVGKETSKKIKAGDIAKIVNQKLNGRGGGKAEMAQGSVENADKELVMALLDEIKNLL